MLGNIVCLMLGGFVGIAAMAICTAGSDRDADAYKAGYENGKSDGRAEACIAVKCPAYERYIKSGE